MYFKQIKNKVYEWGQQYIKEGNDYIELSKNNDTILIFDLTFYNCLAQIVVKEDSCAPYKNVSFEALTLADSKKSIKYGYPEMIYFFYDSEDTTEDEVITELDKGIQYCLNYIPDELRYKYINKTGVLDIENQELTKLICPDDLQKIKKNLWTKEFVCTDTRCQYLILESGGTRIMVLPNAFKVTKDN